MMYSRILGVAVLLSLIGCSAGAGGPNDPDDSPDDPYAPLAYGDADASVLDLPDGGEWQGRTTILCDITAVNEMDFAEASILSGCGAGVESVCLLDCNVESEPTLVGSVACVDAGCACHIASVNVGGSPSLTSAVYPPVPPPTRITPCRGVGTVAPGAVAP